jgi:hypothetical protein
MPIKKTSTQVLIELSERNQQYPDRPLDLLPNQTYSSTYSKLWFRCRNNHIFETSPHNVLKGHDCKKCSMKRVTLENRKDNSTFIKQLEQRNEKFPNKKVSLVEGQIYQKTNEPLSFRCMQGHVWNAIPKTIIRGSYCPECKRNKNILLHTYTTDTFIKLLDERNNTFNEKKVFLHSNQEYKGFKSPLAFFCDKNHEWISTPDNVLNAKSGCPICARKSYSSKCIQWLKEIQKREKITIQHMLHKDGEYIIPGTRLKVDGFCKETNTVYEFYGDYWHGNPLTTNHTQLNEITQTTFGDLYSNTVDRENKIKSLGYKLVSIWESDYDKREIKNSFNEILNNLKITSHTVYMWTFNQLKQTSNDRYFLAQINKSEPLPTFHIFEDEWEKNKTLVISKLKHYTNQNNITTIYARKCIIKPVDTKEKSTFLNQFHLQGNDNSQIAYGAFYANELVGVMTFSQPRMGIGVHKNKQENTFELVRFATNTNYRIPGIASKLLTHFKKNHKWNEIYSYADRRWSIGSLYYTLGFELIKTNPPDYFYIIDGKRKHRWNYRKDILKKTLQNYDANLTEYQNMQNHGYYRVWDCGTLKFSIKNSQKT